MKKIPSLITRTWITAKGEKRTAYYYQHPRIAGARPKPTSLGTDYSAALKQWADLHKTPVESYHGGTVGFIHANYMQWANRRHLSNLSIRTIDDREKYWRKLEPVFSKVQADDMKPVWLMEYFEARSSQASAKKEIKYLSVMFNWAKARDYMHALNPCHGIMRQMVVDESRNIYVTDASYDLVHKCGDQAIKDTLKFLYITASRPTEAFNAKKTDIVNGELHIKLSKTERSGVKIKRLPVEGDLKQFIQKQKRRTISSQFILSDEKGQKLKAQGQLKTKFNKARDLAAAEAKEKGIDFQRFQLRDLRAKAATDTAQKHGMEEARKLLGHTTEKQTKDYVRPLLGEAAKSLNFVQVEKVIRSSGESDS